MPVPTEPIAHLSCRLLDHDGLMTPMLVRHFGPLTVRQTFAKQESDRFLRHSSIFQAATGEKILEAVLNIALHSLPIGFVDRMQNQDILFGQLLLDLSIDVQIADRARYRSATDQPPRWGRRLTMFHAGRQELICQVDELLVSEPQLLRLAV